jgi:hypothetical protein
MSHGSSHNELMTMAPYAFQALAAPVITDRHANGLARHDLRELRQDCRRASEGGFRKFNESNDITTAKGARIGTAPTRAG